MDISSAVILRNNAVQPGPGSQQNSTDQRIEQTTQQALQPQPSTEVTLSAQARELSAQATSDSTEVNQARDPLPADAVTATENTPNSQPIAIFQQIAGLGTDVSQPVQAPAVNADLSVDGPSAVTAGINVATANAELNATEPATNQNPVTSQVVGNSADNPNDQNQDGRVGASEQQNTNIANGAEFDPVRGPNVGQLVDQIA